MEIYDHVSEQSEESSAASDDSSIDSDESSVSNEISNRKKRLLYGGAVGLTAALIFAVGIGIGYSAFKNKLARQYGVNSAKVTEELDIEAQVEIEEEDEYDECDEVSNTLRRRNLQRPPSNDGIGLNSFVAVDMEAWREGVAAIEAEEEEDVAEIIGGNPLEPGEHPYHVSMGSAEYNFTGINGHWCSGTIITPNVVLSAAECFTDFFSPIGSDFEALEWVDIYRYNLTDDTGVDRVFICDTEFGDSCPADEAYVIRHPLWNATTYDYDFALVFLPDPVDDITPVELNDDADALSTSSDLDTFGWGKTDGTSGIFDDYPEIPYFTTIPYIPTETCTQSPFNYNTEVITDSMFCAGGPEIPNLGRVGPCFLDTGGAALMETSSGPVQVGVVSWGTDCDDETLPAVYARVSVGIDWIKDTACDVAGELCQPDSPTGSPSVYPTYSATSSSSKSGKSSKSSKSSKCSKSSTSSSSSSSSSSTNETTLQSTTIGEKSDSGNNSNDEAKPTGIPVYHVDANRFPQVGAKNKIHGLPTLVLYFEGEEIWRNEGIMMAEEIVDILTKLHEERGWSGVTTETSSTVKQ